MVGRMSADVYRYGELMQAAFDMVLKAIIFILVLTVQFFSSQE
jgi:hypothetical protein